MAAKKNKSKSPQGLGKRVAECIKLLDKVDAVLGAQAPTLTVADKRRLAKPRPNIATVVPTIADLATQYGVRVPSHSVDGMVQDLETARTIEPLRAKAALVLKKLEDTVLVANAQAWSSATAYYTTLRRAEGKDGAIAKQLESLTAYFAKRHPSTKKPKGDTNAKDANANDASASKGSTDSNAAASSAPPHEGSEPAADGARATP